MILTMVLATVLQTTGPATALGVPMGFYTFDEQPCEAGAPEFMNLTKLTPTGMSDLATEWAIVAVQPMGANSFLVKERHDGNEYDDDGEVSSSVTESIYTVLSPTSFTTSDVPRHGSETAEVTSVLRYCDQSRLPRGLWQ